MTNEKSKVCREDNLEDSSTPIQEFYSGANILITGGTGFLGKLLINKLLKSCPDINRIYLLVREKKGKDAQSRIDAIFDDPVFEISKHRNKIHWIAGDCILPGLGLSTNDLDEIVKNVNIVFHMAATVRFDEKLNVAMKINIQGCIDILQICSEMKHLKSFIHVSTAYTQCLLPHIEERFYAPPIEPGKLIALSECITDTQMESITPILLGEWPNTYSFTKSIAEDVIQKQAAGMPVGMYRPGIVISTFNDPDFGWIDNYYGPAGVVAGAGTGLLRIVYGNRDLKTNLVPADLCINGLIATAWDVSIRYKAQSSVEFESPVYNFCTAPTNPITWRYFDDKTKLSVELNPSIKTIWYFTVRKTSNKLDYFVSKIFLHYLPAILFDAFALAVGKNPILLKTYNQIHSHSETVAYFTFRQWDFQLDMINGLWTSLSPRDKELFFFDMRTLDWDKYFQKYFLGIRKYLLKDPIETLPQGLVRWNRLYWAHQILKVCFYALLFLFACRICILFNN